MKPKKTIAPLPDLQKKGDLTLIESFNDVTRIVANLQDQEFVFLLLCTRGRLKAEIGLNSFSVGKNDLLYYRTKDTVYQWSASADFETKGVCIAPSMILPVVHIDNVVWENFMHISQHPVVHIGEAGVELYRHYFELLRFRLSCPQALYRREVEAAIICAGIYDLLAILMGELSEKTVPSYTRPEVLFREFMKLLAENYHKERAMGFYAKTLKVGIKHLSVCVKGVSGRTPFEWINIYVIEEIKRQLKYTDKSIKEIAYFMNFPTLSFFGKYVKLHTGMSPSEYRKKITAQ